MTIVENVFGGPIKDRIQQDTIDILEEALARAKAGHFTEIILIHKNADGTWSNKYSGAIHFSETIGRLEITKLDMIRSMNMESQCLGSDPSAA